MGRSHGGFTGRGRAVRDPRLPPGQYDTGRDWPVLTAEVTPELDTSSWTRQSMSGSEWAPREPTPSSGYLMRMFPPLSGCWAP